MSKSFLHDPGMGWIARSCYKRFFWGRIWGWLTSGVRSWALCAWIFTQDRWLPPFWDFLIPWLRAIMWCAHDPESFSSILKKFFTWPAGLCNGFWRIEDVGSILRTWIKRFFVGPHLCRSALLIHHLDSRASVHLTAKDGLRFHHLTSSYCLLYIIITPHLALAPISSGF